LPVTADSKDASQSLGAIPSASLNAPPPPRKTSSPPTRPSGSKRDLSATPQRLLPPRSPEARDLRRLLDALNRILSLPLLAGTAPHADTVWRRAALPELLDRVSQRLTGGHIAHPEPYQALVDWITTTRAGQPVADVGDREWSFYDERFDTKLFELWCLLQLAASISASVGDPISAAPSLAARSTGPLYTWNIGAGTLRLHFQPSLRPSPTVEPSGPTSPAMTRCAGSPTSPSPPTPLPAPGLPSSTPSSGNAPALPPRSSTSCSATSPTCTKTDHQQGDLLLQPKPAHRLPPHHSCRRRSPRPRPRSRVPHSAAFPDRSRHRTAMRRARRHRTPATPHLHDGH